MKYTEHEKLAKISEQSQFIGEFLDYLQERGKCIADRAFDSFGRPCLSEDDTSIQGHLAEMFQIDLQKLEAEKQDMLEKLRERNK